MMMFQAKEYDVIQIILISAPLNMSECTSLRFCVAFDKAESAPSLALNKHLIL
jgi:hypothetical protein